MFCRFFANVGHIIATRKVVPLLKWCSYGSTVLSRAAAWLTDIPVKVHRFGAIWRIHVYTLIYYVSKANPNLWKNLKNRTLQLQNNTDTSCVIHCRVINKWTKIYSYKLSFVLLKTFCSSQLMIFLYYFFLSEFFFQIMGTFLYSFKW